MLHIDSTSDLQQFGINVLTGEACSYGLRLLCDLTEDGVNLVSAFLGGIDRGATDDPPGFPFPKNWNSGAVASVMLTRNVLFGELAVFALFRAGCSLVVRGPDGSVTGVFPHEHRALEMYDAIRYAPDESREYYFHVNRSLRTRQPSADGRNEHTFTGRTV